MGIAYGGILLGRIFQFNDADGYAIYKKQNVKATVLTTLLHDKLIDATENIMVGVLKVNVFQAERIIPTITICKVVAVTIEQKSVSKSVIVILSAVLRRLATMPSISEVVKSLSLY